MSGLMLQDGECSTPNYPVDIHERITDILADILLEDLRQYPDYLPALVIDTSRGQDNTSPLSLTNRE